MKKANSFFIESAFFVSLPSKVRFSGYSGLQLQNWTIFLIRTIDILIFFRRKFLDDKSFTTLADALNH